MQKKYPNDVVAIALNLDHDKADALPEDTLQKEVLDMLVELNLEVTNVMSSDTYEDVLARHDMFSLPAAIVYDRDGNEFRKFEGNLSYEKQVFPLIAEMLAATDNPTPTDNQTPTDDPAEGNDASPTE